jgi:hypothetical protein
VQLVPDNMLVVVVLAVGVFAPLAGWFAVRRSRQPMVWFLFGALIGPLALALLALAPPGHCPSCAAPVDGWPSSCGRCGRSFAAGPGPLTAVPTPSPPERSDPPRTRRRGPSRAKPPVETKPTEAIEGSPAAMTGEILIIGVYLSGNARLEIGARYGLARVSGQDGDRLRVFGPVDTGEITVRYEGAIDGLEVTGLDDRVIITEREGQSPLMCVFRALGGLGGADLERALGKGPITRP